MSTRVVGDYEAYSTKLITLDAVKFSESADSVFRPLPTSGAGSAEGGNIGLGCTVSEESLKRVGVDVLQLIACPLVSVEDIKQVLAVDPCVASVELDQEMTIDVFGTGPTQNDERKTEHARLGMSSDSYRGHAIFASQATEDEPAKKQESTFPSELQQRKTSENIMFTDKDLAASEAFVPPPHNQMSGSPPTSISFDHQSAAKSETSFTHEAVGGAATPPGHPLRSSHRHFDVPNGIAKFFFFHAFLPSSQQEGREPAYVSVQESQWQSSTATTQMGRGPSEISYPLRSEATTSASAASSVMAPAPAAAPQPPPPPSAGAASATGLPRSAVEPERLPSRRSPVPASGMEDLGASYWRKKSGFHTRAYELASCEKNRVIAVIDTGVAYTHPALASNVWVNKEEIPDNGIDDDKNGFVDDVYGYNFRDNDGDPMDDHGHGTHVAGIIGALEFVSDKGRSHARKRRRSMSEHHRSDDMQQQPEEVAEGQDRQEQQELHEKETEQQSHGSHRQYHEKNRQHQQQKQERQETQDQHHQLEEKSGGLEGGKQQDNQQHKEQGYQQRDVRRWDPELRRPQAGKVRAQQGVCGETSIAGLKFMGSTGNGATSDAIKALNYAVQMNMKLSCNSWGGPTWSEALVSALEAAEDSGHLFIAAAGNQGKNTDEIPHYPASYQLPNVISVAATTVDDELAPFSNRGARTVDVAAPGVKILSTYPPDRFKELSGTSMATPVVAGLAAMLMSLPYDNTKQIKDAILKGVDKIPAVAGLVKSGGRINAEKSVAWLVNELDLDVDMMLQKKQAGFVFPLVYSLREEAHQLTLAGKEQSEEGENAEDQMFTKGGEADAEDAGRDKTAEEKKKETPQAGKKEKALQHGEKGDKTRKDQTPDLKAPDMRLAQFGKENENEQQVEKSSRVAESGRKILRFLQERCVSDCFESSSE